jgi:Methyltransferase domain
MVKANRKLKPVPKPIRLDIGCGTQKREGWVGLDAIPFQGVDHVFHIGRDSWPFEDGSVEEAYCSHVLEHLTNLGEKWERVHFFNELWRVLKLGGQCEIILPHWCSPRYYGDPTHKEPFSEMAWLYLQKKWRQTNAPHDDAEMVERIPGIKSDVKAQLLKQCYRCDFSMPPGPGFTMHPALIGKHPEHIQTAITFYKDACQDMMNTITKV